MLLLWLELREVVSKEILHAFHMSGSESLRNLSISISPMFSGSFMSWFTNPSRQAWALELPVRQDLVKAC